MWHNVVHTKIYIYMHLLSHDDSAGFIVPIELHLGFFILSIVPLLRVLSHTIVLLYEVFSN